MGHCVSNMIGIRTGGVFSSDTDIDDLKKRIAKVILKMREEKLDPVLGGKDGDPSHCMSKELIANKGSYVVLAGVFNYWKFEYVSEFAKRLSEEFGKEVMLMSWDEERNNIQCQIYLGGKELFEVNENPFETIIRRVN